LGVFLVDDNDASGNAGAVKQVDKQTDDAFDVAFSNQVLADVGLGVATEQYAVRQNASALPCAFQRTDDMQQVGVIALFVRRRTEIPEAPVRIVKRVDAGAPAFVADVFDKQQHEDLVLVLTGIHAAAKLIATGPEG